MNLKFKIGDEVEINDLEKISFIEGITISHDGVFYFVKDYLHAKYRETDLSIAAKKPERLFNQWYKIYGLRHNVFKDEMAIKENLLKCWEEAWNASKEENNEKIGTNQEKEASYYKKLLKQMQDANIILTGQLTDLEKENKELQLEMAIFQKSLNEHIISAQKSALEIKNFYSVHDA